MKKLLLVFNFLLFLAVSAFAQEQRIEYSYDNAGNRLLRRVITLEALVASPNMAKKKTPDPVQENVGERKIKVYPNPTKGALVVEIIGGDEHDKLELELFTMQGVKLKTIKVLPGTTPIDMLPYPSGTYILRIVSGDNVRELKIIKQ